MYGTVLYNLTVSQKYDIINFGTVLERVLLELYTLITFLTRYLITCMSPLK